MLLSARPLKDVSGVNSFEYTETILATEGDSVDLYFQIIDKSLDLSTEGYSPSGRRYVPASGATLQLTLQNIDDAKSVIRYAQQPYPTQDPSIWKMPVLATDNIKGSYTLQLVLTEGAKVTRGSLQKAVNFQSLTQSFC